jgi:1-acyl-sn-glycerol-3-phosphate acyltransferase
MRTWFYRPGAAIVGWLVRFLLGRPRLEGLENVPRHGAFILASNHLSLADPPIVGWAAGYRTGRVIHFMAKEEMRRWPILGWLATQSGVFFVRRGEADRAAHRVALELLAAGRPIALFPEGTRSRNGVLASAQSGVALLAMRSGAPIVPVGISGTERIFPGRSRMPHRTRITVRIGRPLSLPHQPAGRLDRALLAEQTERVMGEIAALLPAWQRGRYGGTAATAEVPQPERGEGSSASSV